MTGPARPTTTMIAGRILAGLVAATPLTIGVHAAAATPDVALGKYLADNGNGQGAVACSSCHGDAGQGMAATGFPRLAGMDDAYLARQLESYQNGARNNPVMGAMAKSLTSAQIVAVASYYATLPLPAPTPAPAAEAALRARGQRIAQDGIWAKGVPPCVMCHGAGGDGIAPHFPAIVQQPIDYIATQLVDWQQGRRSNDPGGLMKSVALKLTADEIGAVSAWLAYVPAAAVNGKVTGR